MGAVFEHLSSSLHRELDFRQEASNIERMAEVLKGYPRLDVPGVFGGLSTSRLLVMEEIQGIPISKAPQGPERKEAARQLLESYYKQIMVDGFFHADPHPGNLMWWKDRIYFLDFGMVGEVGADMREQLMLLLMAFWQEDVGFLTDVSLMLAGAIDRSDLDVTKFQEEIGELMAKYRTSSLADIQLGPILQEMTEVSIRHDVPLPASLALTGKALAQMQLATAELDPELDPFDVAGKFLMRQVLTGMGAKLEPEGAVLPVAAAQGPVPADGGGHRAAHRGSARPEARGELPRRVARGHDPPGRAEAGHRPHRRRGGARLWAHRGLGARPPLGSGHLRHRGGVPDTLARGGPVRAAPIGPGREGRRLSRRPRPARSPSPCP